MPEIGFNSIKDFFFVKIHPHLPKTQITANPQRRQNVEGESGA